MRKTVVLGLAVWLCTLQCGTSEVAPPPNAVPTTPRAEVTTPPLPPPADAGGPGVQHDAGGDARSVEGTLKARVKNMIAPDIGQGWSSTTYAPSIKKFLAIFVNHLTPGGYQDNSLRAFDPATQTVEVIHPKNVEGAPIDMDNHEMLLNPVTNQVWIMGNDNAASVLDIGLAYGAKSTPPRFGAVGWTATNVSQAAFGAAAGIEGWPASFSKWNAVVHWDQALDIGVIWSGVSYTGLGVSNDLYLIKPNTKPGARYRFVEAGNFDAQLAHGYNGPFDGRHNGKIVNHVFYTLSLDSSKNVKQVAMGKYQVTVDLLAFDLSAGDAPPLIHKKPLVYTIDYDPSVNAPPEPYDTASALAKPGMFFPCVTADTNLSLLLVYLAWPPPHNLWAYDPAKDTWQEVPTDIPAKYHSLAACDYSPDHGVHAYWDGFNGEGTTGWSTVELYRE